MKLTLKDAARSLNLPESTILRWIQQGKIPMYKKDSFYTCNQLVIEKWAKEHNLLFSFSENIKKKCDNLQSETLVYALKRGGVLYNIDGKNTNEVLESAVNKIPFIESTEKNEFTTRLIEREILTSTGVGKGVAIPHPRSPVLLKKHDCAVITTCFLKNRINFNAIDNKEVFVMFILLSPTTKDHLFFLSKLAFCLRDNSFINFLKTIPEKEALFEKIDTIEKNI